MEQPRDIVILGAGIGGLATAAALARAGARVEVIEQAPEIAEVGAGLQITPNGMRVLAALGLGEALAAGSIASRGVVLRDGGTGHDVFRMPLDAAKGMYRFVHRADLIALLARAARDAGATIRLNTRVDKVVGGPRPRLTGAGFDRQADLVVGADGLRSLVRPVLNGISKPRFTGQVAWRAIQPNLIGHPPEARVHMGPGRHLVSYPIRDGHSINIVGVEERKAWAAEGWSHFDDPANLRNAFARFAPEVQEMLAGVSNVGLWGLFRHPVARVWHGQGLALLGDAAHPTLPFLAQGANMALEDAWTLAQALATEPDPGRALAAYQQARRDRVVRIVEAANRNAWAYHLSGPMRLAAHGALRAAGAIRPGLVAGRFDWIYDFDPVQAASSTQTGT